MKKIELLAPVGSMESLHAAVNNGADAVYLGGKLFNARQYASNFDEEELKTAIEYAHARGVKVYLTLNISVKNSELEELRSYLDFLSDTDIDALIVQDLGVINIIRKDYPKLKIHGSTQMTINNKSGVEFLKNQGLERVVLARELSISEIESIKRETDTELEVFIHGALCVSYSGQCLMSSMIGGRSGNRGRCAQTCRMPFQLMDQKDGSAAKLDGSYVLSPKDLNTVDNIGRLIDIGVDSFKIEGRMKKPEYVALIVSKYRKAIDSHINKSEDKTNERDREDIRKIFNRGFTKGFLGEDFGQDYISLDKPNNRGTYVGEVLEIKRGKARIRLEAPLMKGDGLSADNADGSEDFFNIDKIFVNRKESEIGKTGQIVEVQTYRPMKESSKLYKTFDKELDDRIKAELMSKEKDILRDRVDFEAEFRIGKNPVLRAKCGDIEVEATDEFVIEEAQKAGLSEKRAYEQLEKLTDTEYELSEVTFKMDEKVFMPVSVLNSLRRSAIEKLNQARDSVSSQENRIETQSNEEVYRDRESVFVYEEPKLSVEINSLRQLKKLNLNKLDRLYISYGDGSELEGVFSYLMESAKTDESVSDGCDNSDFEIFITLPKVISDSELKEVSKKLSEFTEEYKTQENKLEDCMNNGLNNGVRIDGISVSNIGVAEFIKTEFPGFKIHADSSFNIYNSESAKFLNNNGIEEAGISPELNISEIRELVSDFDYGYEATIYGYLKLMTMKNCPMALIKKCGKDRDCLNCNLTDRFSLKDRMDVDFRVSRTGELTTIYNSKLLFVPEFIESMKSSKIEYYKMEISRDDEDIEKMQDLFYRAVKIEIEKSEIERFIKDENLEHIITRGHYNRGVI